MTNVERTTLRYICTSKPSTQAGTSLGGTTNSRIERDMPWPEGDSHSEFCGKVVNAWGLMRQTSGSLYVRARVVRSDDGTAREGPPYDA